MFSSSPFLSPFLAVLLEVFQRRRHFLVKNSHYLLNSPSFLASFYSHLFGVMVFIPSALVAVVLFSILDGVYCSCGHGTYLHRRITKTVKRQEIAAEQKVVEVGKFGYIGAQGPLVHTLIQSVLKNSKLTWLQDTMGCFGSRKHRMCYKYSTITYRSLQQNGYNNSRYFIGA